MITHRQKFKRELQAFFTMMECYIKTLFSTFLHHVRTWKR